MRCGGKARRDGMKRCVVRRDQTGETGWVGLNIVQAKILVQSSCTMPCRGHPDPTKSVCIQKRQLTPPWQRRNSGRGDGALLRFPSRRRRAYSRRAQRTWPQTRLPVPSRAWARAQGLRARPFLCTRRYKLVSTQTKQRGRRAGASRGTAGHGIGERSSPARALCCPGDCVPSAAIF